MREFARLTFTAPIPEDTTIMNFRHLLEKHKLAPAILAVINGYLQGKGLSLRQGTFVDATIIHAASSTENEEGKRDPEMHQTKKPALVAQSLNGATQHPIQRIAENVAEGCDRQQRRRDVLVGEQHSDQHGFRLHWQ